MIKIKRIYTILTLLIFISCSSRKKITSDQIVGKYQWSGFSGVGSTIELNTNQTFVFHWQQGLLQGVTNGTWKQDGKYVIFHSGIQPNEYSTDLYEIIKTERKNTDSILFKVIGSEDDNFPFVNCELKYGSKTIRGGTTNFQGAIEFPRLEYDSIILSYVGYRTIRYKLDSSLSSYTFKMKKGNELYEYFTKEKWIYKNGHLYDPSIKIGEFVEKNYYEKIK